MGAAAALLEQGMCMIHVKANKVSSWIGQSKEQQYFAVNLLSLDMSPLYSIHPVSAFSVVLTPAGIFVRVVTKTKVTRSGNHGQFQRETAIASHVHICRKILYRQGSRC